MAAVVEKVYQVVDVEVKTPADVQKVAQVVVRAGDKVRVPAAKGKQYCFRRLLCLLRKLE